MLYDTIVQPYVFYPNWQEIVLQPVISLKNLENFFISNHILFFLTKSYNYLGAPRPNHYFYFMSRNEWREGGQSYYPVKVIIKNNPTSVYNEGELYQFQVKQNFPNPFNSFTKISFILEKGGAVQLKIFDILGKEQMQLINEYKGRGEYFIDFNPKNFNSGCYFYTLLVDGISITKKMMYLK